MMYQCHRCEASRLCRTRMVKEAEIGDQTGVAYWQLVLGQYCKECRRSKEKAREAGK